MRRVSWLTSFAPRAYGCRRNRGGGRASHHDYKRHGTTTLFAALDVLEGMVISQCMQRHRNQEFIRFLNAIERQVPAGKVIHVVLDKYAAHKHPNVRKWLARHPRWIFHFTPTSCSWLNAVEGFFARLTRRRLKNAACSLPWSRCNRPSTGSSTATTRTPCPSPGEPIPKTSLPPSAASNFTDNPLD
jgi:transposase